MVYFALQMQSSLLINCKDSKKNGKRTDKLKQSKGRKKKDQAEGKRHE